MTLIFFCPGSIDVLLQIASDAIALRSVSAGGKPPLRL